MRMHTRDFVRVQAHAQERANALTHATRKRKCACVRVFDTCLNRCTQRASVRVQTTRNLQMRMRARDLMRVQMHAEERAHALMPTTQKRKCACVRVFNACSDGRTQHANVHVQTTPTYECACIRVIMCAFRRTPRSGRARLRMRLASANAHAYACLARVRTGTHGTPTRTCRRLGTYKCACTCVVFSACRRAPGAAARANANGSETANAHACARFARARGHRKKRRCAHVGAICARSKRRYHRATVPQYPNATVPQCHSATGPVAA